MKDFDNWHPLKKKLDSKKDIPRFSEREIWWASIGVNVGHEQDGKNKEASRPVMIVKKFNQRLFWGVPLTTQIKQIPHYYHFTFKNREQCAMLTQLRLWDANRLTGRLGRIAGNDFEKIRSRLSEYLK